MENASDKEIIQAMAKDIVQLALQAEYILKVSFVRADDENAMQEVRMLKLMCEEVQQLYLGKKYEAVVEAVPSEQKDPLMTGESTHV